MSDLAKVVLRDVPKQEARIDLWTMPIKGGFRYLCWINPRYYKSN